MPAPGDGDWNVLDQTGLYAAVLQSGFFPPPADGWLIRQAPATTPTAWVQSSVEADPGKELNLPVQSAGSYVVQAAYTVGGVIQTWSSSQSVTI